jgi:hypothetical protein
MHSLAFSSFPLFTLAVVAGPTLALKSEATTICIPCAVKSSNNLFTTTIVDGGEIFLSVKSLEFQRSG